MYFDNRTHSRWQEIEWNPKDGAGSSGRTFEEYRLPWLASRHAWLPQLHAREQPVLSGVSLRGAIFEGGPSCQDLHSRLPEPWRDQNLARWNNLRVKRRGWLRRRSNVTDLNDSSLFTHAKRTGFSSLSLVCTGHRERRAWAQDDTNLQS